MYSIEDKNEILRLLKIVRPSQEDLDSIFRLYKKFVNPNASGYSTTCNCSTGIVAIYNDVRDWWGHNQDKFIPKKNVKKKVNDGGEDVINT